MFARHFIDSLEFAKNAETLQGTFKAREMPRLQAMLDTSAPDQDGDIRYRLRGLPDLYGKPGLEVTVEGIIPLTCQRCLERLAHPLEIASRLMLLDADALNADLDCDDEPEDGIAASEKLDVAALVEDEILLSLPFAPKHPEGACRTAENRAADNVHPFAALASLKNRQP